MDMYITLHIITQSDSHFDARYENRSFDNPNIGSTVRLNEFTMLPLVKLLFAMWKNEH